MSIEISWTQGIAAGGLALGIWNLGRQMWGDRKKRQIEKDARKLIQEFSEAAKEGVSNSKICKSARVVGGCAIFTLHRWQWEIAMVAVRWGALKEYWEDGEMLVRLSAINDR